MTIQSPIAALRSRLIAIAEKRPPDFVVGDDYMHRWWVIPRNKIFNVYLHHFLHSDDDRAHHDHPWISCSVLLKGSYTEHAIAAGGVNKRREYKAGNVKFRMPRSAHRIELSQGECWSLFLTGPAVRSWGFHCPNGWRHWREFTDSRDTGRVGKGCAE